MGFPTPPMARTAALLACLLAATPALAQACQGGSPEHVRMEPVRIAPLAPSGPREVPGILSVPQGWGSGCPAVLLTWEGLDPPGVRAALVSGLLEHGVAVLELDVASPRGFSPDSGSNPPGYAAPALVPDLFGALRWLRQDHGAGPVVVLGFGTGGQAALLAARQPTAGAALRFEAGGSLDMGGDFAMAEHAPRDAGWHALSARLCRVVSGASRVPRACTAQWAGRSG